MKQTVDVKWSKDWGLSEIYCGGLQMALAGPPDKNGMVAKATTFVTCKDFFQDAVQAHHLNTKRAIYSFHYDPSTDPALSFDRFRVLIGNNTDKDFASKIDNVLDFIHQFEKKIHVLRTKAFECKPCPEKFNKTGGVYLFEGSGKWMIAPPMVSLYTLLLRCGFSHKIGEDFDVTCKKLISGEVATVGDKNKSHAGCNDDNYLKGAKFGMDALIKHGYAKIFYKDPKNNFPEKISISTMHNSCGIVGFSNKNPIKLMPYWYRLLDPSVKVKKTNKKVVVDTQAATN